MQSEGQLNKSNRDVVLEKEVDAVVALLGEVIFLSRLRTRSKDFISPGEVYHEEGSASAVRGVQREIDTARNLEGQFAAKEDLPKKLATLSERAMIVFSANLGWLGDKTTPRQAYKTDDILKRRGADFWAMWESGGVKQAASCDTTSNARQASQKIANALERIHAGTLHELRMGEVSAENTGVDMRGKISFLPHFQLVISRERALDIKRLVETKRWDLLAVHPMQIDCLEQLLAQARMYRAYVATLKLETVPRTFGSKLSREEYARIMYTKGYAEKTMVDQHWRKRKILDIFDRCITCFEHALQERREILECARSEGSEDVRGFLGKAGVPDREHERFMQLFEKQSEEEKIPRKPSRLRALVHVLPPQARTKDKPPLYSPRYTRAMRGRRKSADNV